MRKSQSSRRKTSLNIKLPSDSKIELNDYQVQGLLAEFNATIDFAKQLINILFFANAGACVSLLTFLGTLYSTPSRDKLLIDNISNAAFFFGVGVVAVLLTSLSAYIFQMNNSENRESKKLNSVLRILAIIFAGCSIIALTLGICKLLITFK